MNLELKYRILQQLVDEPVDECSVRSLGAAVGADQKLTLQALAELVRDGFIETEPVDTGAFTLRIRQRPAALADVRSQWARRRKGQ